MTGGKMNRIRKANRRHFLRGALTGLLVVIASLFVPPVAAQDPAIGIAPVPAGAMPDGFTLAAVGDLIYLRPMLPALETRSPRMLALLRDADLTFGNFETMAIDMARFEGSPQALSGGSWMYADPRVVADVRDMGFDIVSLANNHSTDWGVEGLAETERRLTEAGLVFAGTGTTLQGARSPRFHHAPQGRVSLIAAASSFTAMSPAGDPVGEVPGRAGLNPLRVDRIAVVRFDQLEQLRAIAGQEDEEETVRLFGRQFRAGPRPDGTMAWTFEPNERDVAGNLLAIRQGRQYSNFAVYSLHNHEPGNDSDTPADFAIAFARQTIDAGADAFVGHGPHILRGIEIYRSRPIFYSLGNFAMMNNALEALPGDFYERLGIEPGEATVGEILQGRAERSFSDSRQFESVIAVSRFDGGEVAEIRLYPIDLGVDATGVDRGVPRHATGATARRILETMQRLSEPFGTSIVISNGVGIIRP
jgi:poly-gamma-glutamate synthesis protein (capsule biosynthesis protein)